MPEIKKVVTTVWYDLAHMKRLRAVFPEAEFKYVNFYEKSKLEEAVKDADVAVILGDVPSVLLGENSLKWIHCDHAGLNGSARPEVFARGIPVTGSAGRSAPALAEHAIYFMLQNCYHTRELLAAQAAGQWGVPGMDSWRGLYGRTAGLIGMGHNGKALAERLHALGMRLIAYNRSPIQGMDYIDVKLCGRNGDSLDPLLTESDFVILNIALTDETFHLINKETIARMKDGAFLVNMARGGVVDTQALMAALESGKLSGAGLDVTEEQPLPADHPLWRMPTVYLTPHSTPQVPDRSGRSIEIIAENARRFRAGEPLMNLMDPSMAVNGDKKEAAGGWSRMLDLDITPEQAAAYHLEKFLGKLDWSDPAEFE